MRGLCDRVSSRVRAPCGEPRRPSLHLSFERSTVLARTFNDLTPPADGREIVWHEAEDRLEVPDRPIIPFIEGDGTGPDIWRATRVALDGAVAKVYGGARS